MNYNYRNSNIIKEQLNDLRLLIDYSKKIDCDDYASKLTLLSLENEEKELVDELHAAELIESNIDAEVVLEGDPVTPGYIHARFFGEFLIHLQDLVNAVAQQIKNDSTSRGVIASSIISKNRLLLAPTFPSSYGARFTIEHSVNPLDQKTLIDVEVKQALDQIASIIEESAEENKLLDELLSHSIIRKHYSELISQLAKGGANVTFRTKAKPKGVKITAQQARDREEWLMLLQKDEDIENLIGTLVGGSIETDRFELRVQEEVIRGAVQQNALKKIREINLSAEVKATVKIIKEFHEVSTMEPKITYILIDIHLINEPNLFSDVQ